MRHAFLALLVPVALSIGCSSGSGSPSPGGSGGGGGPGGGNGGSSSSTGGAGNPNGSCSAGRARQGPAGRHVQPDRRVVGTGTAASCTFAALQTAATAGGVITFDCGAAPVTIPVTATLNLPIDQEHRHRRRRQITLDGGGAVAIISFDSAELAGQRHRPDAAAHRAGQRQGDADRGDPDARPRPARRAATTAQGGALYMRDGYLTVDRLDLHQQPGRAARPRHRRRRDLRAGQQGRRLDRGQHVHQQPGQQRGRGGRAVRRAQHLQQPLHGQHARSATTRTTTSEQVLGDEQRPERDRLGRQRRRDLQRRQRRQRHAVRRRDHQQRRRHERVRRRPVLHQQQLRRQPDHRRHDDDRQHRRPLDAGPERQRHQRGHRRRHERKSITISSSTIQGVAGVP